MNDYLGVEGGFTWVDPQQKASRLREGEVFLNQPLSANRSPLDTRNKLKLSGPFIGLAGFVPLFGDSATELSVFLGVTRLKLDASVEELGVNGVVHFLDPAVPLRTFVYKRTHFKGNVAFLHRFKALQEHVGIKLKLGYEGSSKFKNLQITATDNILLSQEGRTISLKNSLNYAVSIFLAV